MEENDVIPRILLKDIPQGASVAEIYFSLQKFGVITYIGLGNENAIVEFADRVSIGKVLSSQPLRLRTKDVNVSYEPEWQQIAGLVSRQETFVVDVETKATLQNEEAFDAEINNLVSAADRLSLNFDDDPNNQGDSRHRHPVCSVLERVLAEDFSNSIRVYPYGSRVSGTALETSDLDIFIDCDNNFYKEPDVKEEAYFVETVKRRLNKSWPEFNHVVGVPRARVPIVKFLHCPSDTRCDASFFGGLGCRNARLMKFIMSLDMRIRPLLLFLKHWAYAIDMKPAGRSSSRPELTSHALAMLTITYLQTVKPPVLPPIKNMKQSANYSLIVAGWETAFCDNSEQFHITAPDDQRTVYELLLGFMQCFQRVNWRKLAASPVDGAYIQRRLLPHKIATRSVPMVVLDPFNLSRNLTANVSEMTLCRLCAVCALTEKEITTR